MSRNTPWRTARKMYALHQGGNDWYRFRNQADGPTQLHIYDEIGYFGVGAADLIKDLADVSGPIELHLNSPGGEVDDGIAIYNTLATRGGVTVIIDGLAASIASVIAMAGEEILIAKQGKMMVHDGYTLAIGNAEDLRTLATHLDRTSNNIASIYAERTGKTVEFWRELMKVESWYYGQEAIDAGLADKFLPGRNGRAGGGGGGETEWDLSVFNGPGGERDAASVPWVGTSETRHKPMTGRHAHDHAAFGHGDHDDGQHHHAHDHANDSDHDHSHDGATSDGDGDRDKAYSLWVGQLMGMVHVEVLNWDAAAAMKTAKTAGDFRRICAGEHNSGDPDTAAHWALPHHTSPGAGADKGGVVAALGRWNQTEDLKNKDAALAHLKSHARELGLPSGDGDGDGNMAVPDPWLDFSDAEVEQFQRALKGA